MPPSLRLLAKSPGFTAVAVLTLALGIGSVTAIFSTADALIWKTISLPDIDHLMMVLSKQPQTGGIVDWSVSSPADYLDWKSRVQSLQELAGYQFGSANIMPPDGQPVRVQEFLVSSNFFKVVGVSAAIGRTFAPGEDELGRSDEVVLSHGIWQRTFGGDPAVLGKTLKLDGRNCTVIGVMPRDYNFPVSAEVWTPMTLTPKLKNERMGRSVVAIGRLKPGVSRAQAASEMQSIARRIAEQYPDTNKGWDTVLIPVREFVVSGLTRQYTLFLLGAVGFVLLIACANVANLQFARASGRSREIAIRSALGAGRWRVVRQLLAENLLLAAMGAVFGLLLAAWGIDLIKSSMSPEVAKYLPRWYDMGIDARTLAFTVTATVFAALAAGLAPAFQVSRPDLAGTLKEGGRGTSAGRGSHRIRNFLVAGEIALAMVLLVGAGLMVRGFGRLLNDAETLHPDTLLTFRIGLNDPRYKAPEARRAFFDATLARLEHLPGVQTAAYATAVPHTGHSSGRAFTIEGHPPASANEQPVCTLQVVSPSYLRTAGIALKRGRELSARDGAEAPKVAIVSERLVQRYFPGEDPIGRRIQIRDDMFHNPVVTIVGVAADIVLQAWDRGPRPTLYVPAAQMPQNWSDGALRVSGDPAGLVRSLQAAIHESDPELPVFDIRTMTKAMQQELLGLRYVEVMMVIFGVMALVLASIGIYGVLAYSVSERTHEIGLRMALGAGQPTVLGMVIRRGMLLALAGLAVGFTLAFGLARLLASLLWGVTASDPLTFGGISSVLALVALAACYIPARRAASVDPIVALRYE